MPVSSLATAGSEHVELLTICMLSYWWLAPMNGCNHMADRGCVLALPSLLPFSPLEVNRWALEPPPQYRVLNLECLLSGMKSFWVIHSPLSEDHCSLQEIRKLLLTLTCSFSLLNCYLCLASFLWLMKFPSAHCCDIFKQKWNWAAITQCGITGWYHHSTCLSDKNLWWYFLRDLPCP